MHGSGWPLCSPRGGLRTPGELIYDDVENGDEGGDSSPEHGWSSSEFESYEEQSDPESRNGVPGSFLRSSHRKQVSAPSAAGGDRAVRRALLPVAFKWYSLRCGVCSEGGTGCRGGKVPVARGGCGHGRAGRFCCRQPRRSEARRKRATLSVLTEYHVFRTIRHTLPPNLGGRGCILQSEWSFPGSRCGGWWWSSGVTGGGAGSPLHFPPKFGAGECIL